MKFKSYFLPLLCILVTCTTAIAQIGSDKPNQSINISIFNEQLGIPDPSSNYYLNYPFESKNLGAAISIESSPSSGAIINISHMIELGYFKHENLNHVLFIGWKPKVELNILNTVAAHAILGLSYAHSIPTKPSYTLEDGEYNQTRNLGRPHFMPSIGAGLSVDFYGIFSLPLEVFVRHEAFGFLPYAPQGDFPLTLNHKLSLGITISIK